MKQWLVRHPPSLQIAARVNKHHNVLYRHNNITLM